MNNENAEIKDAEDSNPLFDIIQNLQSKLGTQQEEPVPNINFNQNQQTQSNNNKDSSELNMNNIFELLNNVGIGNSQNNENKVTQNTNSQIQPNLSNLNIDLSTIMKFQRFFTSMNKADPRKNLLTSLKPFLRETRQKNIDTYITLLGVINALDIFANKGSDY